MVALVSVPAALALPVLVVLSGPEALVQAFALPGYAKAAGIAVISAGLGTVLALVLAVALLSGVAGRSDRWLRLSMPPLLATPHAAMAVGLAFLIAPSGWLIRLLSPWATGLDRPPLFSMVQDPWGLSLAVGLAIKELPFFVLLALSATRRDSLQPAFRAAISLGVRSTHSLRQDHRAAPAQSSEFADCHCVHLWDLRG